MLFLGDRMTHGLREASENIFQCFTYNKVTVKNDNITKNKWSLLFQRQSQFQQFSLPEWR